MKAEEIADEIEEWCKFGEDRAYILMAITRRKFNEGISNNEEKIHRRVLTEGDDIEEQVAELLGMMDAHDLHFRLYLTVNAHNTLSAYNAFLQEAVGWSEELLNGHEGTKKKIERVSSEWKSVLHNPEHKDDSYFLFDLDGITHHDYLMFVNHLPAQDGSEVSETSESVFTRKQLTPNGYHVITKPFNYTDWQSPIEYDELDTDGQMHIAEIDNRSS